MFSVCTHYAVHKWIIYVYVHIYIYCTVHAQGHTDTCARYIQTGGRGRLRPLPPGDWADVDGQDWTDGLLCFLIRVELVGFEFG